MHLGERDLVTTESKSRKVEDADLRWAKSFIESERFPVALVSRASAKEKQGGGRPEYWEMVFWWTRKPLASARAVIAGEEDEQAVPTH